MTTPIDECTGVKMATVVSFINMKGGVGKSTLAVNLAHLFMGAPWHKRVLIVDLDPQFNASQYLLGEAAYKQRILTEGKPTTWDVLEQNTRTPGRASKSFNIADGILSLRKTTAGGRLDLIPSRLELALSLKNPAQKETLLAKSLKGVLGDYDVVFIDCPPTDSVLTDAAYFASDCIVVPVKPEYLSSIGLPLLQQSISEFLSANPGESLSIAAVAFNMAQDYSPEEDKAKKEVRKLAKTFGWKVLKAEVPYSKSFPKGARETRPITSTSYARTATIAKVKTFSLELAKAIGL